MDLLFSKEFILEDKTKVSIGFFLFVLNGAFTWYIQDIRYKKPWQEDWQYLKSSWYYKSDYTMLSPTERERYDLKQFTDFCGEEILKEAYQDVYEQIKPNILRDSI